MSPSAFRDSGLLELSGSPETLSPTLCREILMTASPHIKTPAMEVPLYRLPQAQARGEQLKKHFTQVCLCQVGFWECGLKECEPLRD